LKINTSNINLSSKRVFSQKDQVTIEKQMNFPDLFDLRVKGVEDDVTEPQMDTGFKSPWYAATFFNGQAAVGLSSQFLSELEKLRQILGAVIDRVNSTGLRGCCLKLDRLNQVNINSFSQDSATLFEYEYQEKRTHTYEEKENTQFFADGVVNTMDGKTIDFSFHMDLEREYFRQDQFVHREKGYVLIDPVVINLDTATPKISETSVLFDLDLDGKKEDMPVPMKGTGFLSLDKNKDGIINDGSELFGPSTGDGFLELSKYDLDHNLWIDENDAIFDDLTLWESTDQGQMQLTRIKDAGIGAIYLASTQTRFDLRDEDNQLQARIKKSGIALNEDGSVSSIQEMDWTA